MDARLVSFLTLIENSLTSVESPAVKTRPQRMMNFNKGLARMVFADGSGSISLQAYVLADGQVCLKAALNWAQSGAVSTQTFYPKEGYNWAGAAEKVAYAWMDGPPETVASAPVSTQQAEGVDGLAAVG